MSTETVSTETLVLTPQQIAVMLDNMYSAKSMADALNTACIANFGPNERMYFKLYPFGDVEFAYHLRIKIANCDIEVADRLVEFVEQVNEASAGIDIRSLSVDVTGHRKRAF